MTLLAITIIKALRLVLAPRLGNKSVLFHFPRSTSLIKFSGKDPKIIANINSSIEKCKVCGRVHLFDIHSNPATIAH